MILMSSSAGRPVAHVHLRHLESLSIPRWSIGSETRTLCHYRRRSGGVVGIRPWKVPDIAMGVKCSELSPGPRRQR